jgi:hypothetical protein
MSRKTTDSDAFSGLLIELTPAKLSLPPSAALNEARLFAVRSLQPLRCRHDAPMALESNPEQGRIGDGLRPCAKINDELSGSSKRHAGSPTLKARLA